MMIQFNYVKNTNKKEVFKLNQTIRETFLEIREIVFNGHNVNIDSYSEELVKKSGLSLNDIKDIYNNMALYSIELEEGKQSRARRRIWGKSEDNLLSMYAELASKEKEIDKLGNTRDKSNKTILSELNDILFDRTEQSISFRYYDIKQNKKSSKNKDIENSKEQETVKSEEKPLSKEGGSDDLLDTVINLVDNIETAGIEVETLFKSLLTMSQKAVENSNVDKISELENRVKSLSDELNKEKEENSYLQLEVSNIIKEFEKMKREIYHFDGLNGKEKLQQLNSFNKNLKYIVDKFGGVISVGA
jgi:hypothetical protein